MKHSRHNRNRRISVCGIIHKLALAILVLMSSGLAMRAGIVPEGPNPMPETQFATITNMIAVKDVVLAGWDWKSYSMRLEQRRQLNAQLRDLAKELSQPETSNALSRYRTLSDLSHLAGVGLVTERSVIPYLIAGLKPEPGDWADFTRVASLRALSDITRRMRGAVCFGGPYWSANNTSNGVAITAWWDEWWKNNENRNPVYDEQIDQKVRMEYFRTVKAIEDNLKPQFPELAYFKARIPLLNCSHQLYDDLYDDEYALYRFGSIWSRTNTVLLFSPSQLPWLSIACRFEDQELPTDWENWQERKPPKNLEQFTTCVYSNKIDHTSIHVKVVIASTNSALVDSLRKALAETCKKPLPLKDEMPPPTVY
jgi:hypothetical protein